MHASNRLEELTWSIGILLKDLSDSSPYDAPMQISFSMINKRLDALAQQSFRAKFHLGQAEQNLIDIKGAETIRRHATVLISDRLAPAEPKNDGRQTPFKGHPVFIAQHATATCCRICLAKWHQIPAGNALSMEQQTYIADVIDAWIVRELRQQAENYARDEFSYRAGAAER